MPKGKVIIETNRCKGCGLCVDVCVSHILQLSEDSFNVKGYRPVQVTDMGKCTGCGVCAIVCPDVVFRVYREKRKKKVAPKPASTTSAA